MSTSESSYKSLLQGVSQQIPKERLPGQVSAQLNMLSDPVTNLRRRPGTEYRYSGAFPEATSDDVMCWYTDLAGESLHVHLNLATGKVRLLDKTLAEVAYLDGGTYLQGTSDNIRATTIANEMFLCNCAVSPYLEYPTGGPVEGHYGFFSIVSGAFGKGYTVTLNDITTTYTTPSGAGANDSQYATPEYIAKAIVNQLKGANATQIRINSLPAGFQMQKYVGSAWVAVAVNDVFTKAQLAANTLRVFSDNSVQLSREYSVSVGFASGWHPTQAIMSVTVLPNDSVMLNDIGSFCAKLDDLPALSGYNVYVEGSYVFVDGPALTVNTQSGSAYIIASKDGYVTSQGNLPARLPSAADGIIIRVGSASTPQYFKYEASTTRWLECASAGSPSKIRGMPISILYNGTAWELSTAGFDGRFAGDDDSNPNPAFLDYGITGMGTYQGRLVLLSGPLVNLSASNKPRSFYRTTITAIVNSDPIEVGSSMNSSSAYRYAVPFQKDLILFSEAYQALIPSGNQAITPSTATVVGTSIRSTDITATPLPIGRTILYPTPRSADFFGVSEMIPSAYTDSQYVSQDATPHLPKYMAGRCRFSVSSSVANMALFAPSGDKRSLIVHEYMWDGENKVQQSWHTWTFPYDVASAYFAGDQVFIAFVNNGLLVLTKLDPKAGVLTFDAARRPYSDMWTAGTISGNAGTIPAWMMAFDPAIGAKVELTVLTGALAGEPVGSTITGSAITTVLSFPSGSVSIGIPYRSLVVPTPPVLRDYNEVAISTNKATILRYLVGTKNSSEYKVSVTDKNSGSTEAVDVGTLTWSSKELELDRALYSNDAVSVVPCRTEMNSTVLELYTDGTGEFNITSLEYVMKYHQKIKRR